MWDNSAAITQVGNTITVAMDGWHLAAMDLGVSGSYKWRTELGTRLSYRGPFPPAGRFDVGNLVNDFAGGDVNVLDRSIVTSYHGEFWKGGQTNKYNHYWDNGLALGQFGTSRDITGRTNIAVAEMAGNATSAIMIEHSGVYYLYHGDESDHSGIHRWKIDNLASINEQTVNIPFPNMYVAPVLNYVDLFAGVPYDTVLPASVAGWTRTPSTEQTGWSVITSYYTYDSFFNSDIRVNFYTPSLAATNYLTRDLGTNNVTNSWEISGNIAWEGKDGNIPSLQLFLDVLDDTGKIIATVCHRQNYVAGINEVLGNNVAIVSALRATDRAYTRYFKPLKIVMNMGTLFFTYNNSAPISPPMVDLTANWHKPKTLRVRCVATPALGPTTVNLSMNIGDFRLYKDHL